MSAFQDCYWSSRDGLRLHYRDYPGDADAGSRPPVLCLPGLTRNCRDFETLAARTAPHWRVLCPDMRGRGDSAYARTAESYQPWQYVDDVVALLDHLGIERAVLVGTSLGGLMAMLMALRMPDRIAAAVLNDIGPELEREGLDRIIDYVGQGRSFPTWMHAARALQDSQGDNFPAFELSDWLAMAKRVMTLGQNGRIVFDYDMKIAEPFAAAAAEQTFDMWPAFDALATRPLLVLRGALSDLFSDATLAAMLARAPGADAVTVPQVGHAPTLDEPESVAAIERLLARLG